jgi:hypothetical protein
MRVRTYLVLMSFAAFASVSCVQQSLVGTWYHDDKESDRVVTTEIVFRRGGEFSLSFTHSRGTAKSSPVVREDGKWSEREGVIEISLAGNAPVGVSPRQDRELTSRIQKLTSDSLWIAYEASGSREFRRRPLN